MRLVRRWKPKGAEVVLQALKANVEHTGNPVALGTLVLRGISDFDKAWVSHASLPWFGPALTGLDIPTLHDEVVNRPGTTSGARYGLMRSALLRELKAVRDRHMH